MKRLLMALAAIAVLQLVIVGPRSTAAASIAGTAAGTVTFDAAAGTLRAQATGLSQNFGGFANIGWLVNEATGAKLNTGAFVNGLNSFGVGNVGDFNIYVITFERASNTTNTPEGLPVAKATVVLPRGTSPLQPTISGTVDVSDTAVAARLAGLPALPTGFEYVGWLVNEKTDKKLNTGVLTAGGVNNFTSGGVSVQGFTAYVVTYEPLGNRSNNPAGMPVAKAAVAPAAPGPVAPPATGDGGLLESERVAGVPAASVVLAIITFGIGVAVWRLPRRSR